MKRYATGDDLPVRDEQIQEPQDTGDGREVCYADDIYCFV